VSKRKSAQAIDELSQYDEVILAVFNQHYHAGAIRLVFQKDELAEICRQRSITVRNIPDIIYSYRSRRSLPTEILQRGHWAIESAGRSAYAFRLLSQPPHFAIAIDEYEPIDIYNALPEVVEGLLRNDEQSLLTRILYNRLVDIFTGLTCFHIQNHYRSFVNEVGEVELDALYVGVDKDGQLFIIPLEAKSAGHGELLGRIQVAQMAGLARQDFAEMKRRLLAVKQLPDGTIAFVEFSDKLEPDDFKVISVSRFRLVRRENKTTP